MTLSTGAVSFDDIRSEFGMSGAISIADLYRGGSNVRAKAGDNTGVNLAASVPTSGVISIADFQGQAKGFRFTFTSAATNQNASTLFGDDYDLDYPKEIVINNGVELGATSSSEEALEVPAGAAGSITITNNGTLSGAGGAAGQAGGDAFETAVAVTFVNNGVIRAGGGGGGTGGNGSYSSSTYVYHVSYSYWYTHEYSGNRYAIRYGNVWRRGTYFSSPSQMIYGPGVTSWSIYSRTGSARHTSYDEDGQPFRRYAMYVSGTAYSNGGTGGVGQGYNQSAGSGSGGGTNAGSGGSGASFGSSGSTGANGNSTNGSAGGAAGKYIRGISLVSLTDNGSVLGGTA